MSLRVSILTREYPPHIYGGAGVHVAEVRDKVRAHILERLAGREARYVALEELCAAGLVEAFDLGAECAERIAIRTGMIVCVGRLSGRTNIFWLKRSKGCGCRR